MPPGTPSATRATRTCQVRPRLEVLPVELTVARLLKLVVQRHRVVIVDDLQRLPRFERIEDSEDEWVPLRRRHRTHIDQFHCGAHSSSFVVGVCPAAYPGAAGSALNRVKDSVATCPGSDAAQSVCPISTDSHRRARVGAGAVLG